MNKIQKMSLKYRIALGFSILASVFGLSTFAVAGNFFNWSNVESQVADKLASKVTGEDMQLGANSIDGNASNYENVNGFITYTMVAYMGNGNGAPYATTTAVIQDPFETPTSTSADVVINQISSAYGYTGATSTVSLVEITGSTVTTTAYEFDCTASASRFTTSTPAIVDTEAALPASNRFMVRSGMTSSTNPGAGSLVLTSGTEVGGAKSIVNALVLTPQKPYLVCKVWSTTGASLSSFTDTNGTADVKVVARISRRP